MALGRGLVQGLRLGPECPQGRARHGGGRAMAGCVERHAQALDDQCPHMAGVTEAHFRLGGVDVHIDLSRIDLDEQRQDGVAVTGEKIRVGAADSPCQELVTHGPSVHEQILRLGVAAIEGGQARMAVDCNALSLNDNGHDIVLEVAPEDARQPRQMRLFIIGSGFRIKPEHGAAFVGERKRDARMGHGDALDDIADSLRLGTIRFQELEPGGGREEDVAHLDARARGRARGPWT